MTRAVDGWPDYPGDICSIKTDLGWDKPGGDKGSVYGRESVNLDRTKFVTIIAILKDLGPWGWVWCLVLADGARLCWLPTSVLRRIDHEPHGF